MPQVRNMPSTGPYVPATGEHLLQLANTGDVPLWLGIRNGEYMIAAAAGEPSVTYILDTNQWVRLQQQMSLQPTYKKWIASGLLTLVEVLELPVPEPPPPPPPPEEETMPETPAPAEPPAEPAPVPEPAPEPEPEPEDAPTQ